MLCMYCPHGICIAFTVLTRHEGPSAAVEMIVQRFTTGPSMIVYDNVSAQPSALRVYTQDFA